MFFHNRNVGEQGDIIVRFAAGILHPQTT